MSRKYKNLEVEESLGSALAVPNSAPLASPPEEKLTIKEQRWVEAFCAHGNRTRAAKEAGYAGTYHTLCQIGWQNYNKPKIQAVVAERLGRFGMGNDEYLALLCSRARSSMSPFLPPVSTTEDGESLPGEAPKVNLTSEEAQASTDFIKKIKTTTHTTVTDAGATETVSVDLEVYDRLPALKVIGDMLGHKTGSPPPAPTNQTNIQNNVHISTAPTETKSAKQQLADLLCVDVDSLPDIEN